MNVESCPAVTDSGIKGLCVSVDDQGIQHRRVGQCKSIDTLIIRHTKVTKEGIQIALENLPLLKIFAFCLPIHILAEIFKHYRVPPHSLADSVAKFGIVENCENCSIAFPYKIGSLKLVASLCSFTVTKLDLILQRGITDTELLGLLALEKIRELAICSETNVSEEITFDGGVVPILSAFGNSLKCLKIAHLKTKIDIGAIIEHCTQLPTLYLYWNESFKKRPENERPFNVKRFKVGSREILPNLEFFYLCNAPDLEPDDCPTYYLTPLLLSPKLREFTITTTLLHVVNQNQLCHLEELTIQFCDQVTKKGIEVFLKNRNALKYIYLGNCKLLTKQVFDELESLIKEKNWELIFFFF